MNKNVKKFIELVTNNPELRVIPMVDTDVVVDNSYCDWQGSIGNSRLDEVYFDDDGELYFIREKDELIDDLMNELFRSPDVQHLNYDEILDLTTKAVDNFNWEKVIIVDIDLP